MESIVGQNMIIKKLSNSIIGTENTVLNQRFTFYKLTCKDSFGVHFMPPRGSGFELLNRCLMQENVDHVSNNLLRQAKRLNVNVYSNLERACNMIHDSYKKFVDVHSTMDQDVPLKEQFELERAEQNKEMKMMEGMVADSIEMSANILKDTNKHRDENEQLKRKLAMEREQFENTIASLKREEQIKLDDLLAQLRQQKKEYRDYRERMIQELDVKEALIEKLKNRNEMLESLMKKAVRIMRNPAIMQEAFRKFNFDRYVYTTVEGEEENIDIVSENFNETNDSRGGLTTDRFDVNSEKLTSNRGTNKDLILVETQS